MRRLNNFSDKIIVMVLVFIFSITNNVYGQDALKTHKKIDKELAKLLKDKSIKSAFEYIDAIEEETNKNYNKIIKNIVKETVIEK